MRHTDRKPGDVGSLDFSYLASLSVSAARVFGVTVRILNRTLSASLLTRGSPEYQDFARQLLHEVKPGAGAVPPPPHWRGNQPRCGAGPFGDTRL